MRLPLTSLSLVLLLVTRSGAQSLYLGPVIGVTQSRFRVGDASEPAPQLPDGTGPSFGVVVGFQLDRVWSVESGANIYSYPDDPYTDTKLYLNLPIVLMTEFPRASVIKARLRAGPQFGIKLNDPQSSLVHQHGEPLDEPTKSPELNAFMSIGIGVGMGESMNWFLDIGGWAGLSDVSKTSISIKHHALFLGAGLSFRPR